MAVKKALVLSCLLGASFLAQAAPASFVVQDIQVEGLQRVTLGAALLNLPIRVGDYRRFRGSGQRHQKALCLG